MKRIAWLATLPLLALPAFAQAADGYTTGNVNLRAGPDSSYPLIETIPAGAPLDVQGCTSGWEWCDVIFQGDRGWIAGNFIQYDYNDQYVLVPQYGAQIGIPIVSFVIGTYWDSYYRNRPFYRQRARWYARPVPRRPPPPPVHRPAPPHGAMPNRPVPPHGGTPNRPAPPHGNVPNRPAPPHGNVPNRPVPPHGATPQQPARPMPERNPQPMPQRPQATRPAEARPAAQRHAPTARPGTGKPAPAHGKPAPRDKGDHQDH